MIVEVKNAMLQYDSGFCVRNLDFDIDAGEYVIITGPTGSGKSSVLRLIYMDLFPSAGSVSVLGVDSLKVQRRHISSVRQQIGLVSPDLKLLEDRDIFGNLILPLELQGKPANDARQRVQEIADRLKLRNRLGHQAYELSAGERKRVELARALVIKPEILIIDEPLSHLDTENIAEVFSILEEEQSAGMTVIAAAQDDLSTYVSASRMLEMKAGKLLSENR